MADRASIDALANMLTEIELLISTTDPLPENRTPRSLELIRAAKGIVDDAAKSRKADAFRVVLQEVARWRRQAPAGSEFEDRDRFLLRLEQIGRDVAGPVL